MAYQKIKAIHGTRDILPAEAPRWEKVISAVSRVAAAYNYGLIINPIFEATELFARGIGETSDVVTKEMYTFFDQGKRSLTLRPEGTASVMRAYLEHSLGAGQGLVKVWYAGPMFRQERPQAGRYRQFYQFGIEAIGSLDPALDAEVIVLNRRIFDELGIEDLLLEINSIGMPSDRKAHRQSFVEFVEPILDKFCEDCGRRFETNPLRMFDCKEETCRRNLAGAPVVYDFLSDDNLKHFEKVMEYLELAGISYSLNKKLVRGLDYYTRTAWEFKSGRLGSQDSLSGGGRYDLLSEQLGGPSTPGIGFAAGIERIILVMPEQAVREKSVRFGFYIAAGSEEFKTEAVKLAYSLRSHGVAADIDYLGRSLKSQMKQADKSGFEYTVILAQDEMSKGAVVLRNMVDSSQFELKLSDIYSTGNAAELGELIERKRK